MRTRMAVFSKWGVAGEWQEKGPVSGALDGAGEGI
jgi:hypothetical protein